MGNLTAADLAALRRMYACFAGERFTIRDVHCKVYSATSHYPHAHEQAEYSAQLARLEGFVERRSGPRGGEGYGLTARGITHAQRMAAAA